MERSYKTPAIVLRHRPVGEADVSYTLYTKFFGKIDVLGKGAKKIQSKLHAHMPIGSETLIMCARGAMKDRLTGAVLMQAHPGLRQSYLGMCVMAYICEWMDIFLRGQEMDDVVYEKVKECLTVVEKAVSRSASLPVLLFTVHGMLLQILHHWGDGVDMPTFMHGVKEKEYDYYHTLLLLSVSHPVRSLPRVKALGYLLAEFNTRVYGYMRGIYEQENRVWGLLTSGNDMVSYVHAR